MKRKYILLLICSSFLSGIYAQTIEQARALYTKGNYEEAKPVFKKFAKSQPSNGNYNFWYGVCCLKTGEAEEAIPYLETAVKKRITSGQLYLGQAYNESYRFEDAVNCFEEYIEELSKRKKSTEDIEALLEKSRSDLRMLKGVEEVCIIDSFVVDKTNFLSTYKISEESGKLFTFNEFFQTEGKHPGTVYETEIGNKIYYSEQAGNGHLDIFSKNKLANEWSNGRPLPGSINESGNTNYPFVLADGLTIYYATDGEGLGGYDIFVTRYNTNTDTYLTPENVGMPFNSPYNDYMYVIDEYNNLGWFASDRFQPEGKVCIYVFIPNSSKKTYNYEAMDSQQIIRLARINSLKETWKDKNEVNEALQRLQEVISHKPQEHRKIDFEFVIDDNTTYYLLSDFKSSKAKQLFQRYQQLEKDYLQQEDKLESQRQQYAQASKQEKDKIAPAILDLEKRVLQMSGELETVAISIRNAEKTNSK
ncbi:tetratricopeptide repeat protein [Bacteroides sp.]|uniref:tetratricopeptide repeat protein n=1 Tax=Bacteroides sp. TaxID=29523 RepID=UPI00260D8617|nr:tetratricopeptide repeat protein [Bacteroides sp.]MDD3037338.1 tetratricopeptide repeat protein [Bacteroides sp.]